jgi:putative transposase
MRPDGKSIPHRKRCHRINTPGHAHYLTFSCFHRQPFLSRDRSRQWLLDAIDLARSKHSFDLWAYIIMPEHAHLILFPTRPNYDISDIFGTIKLSVTRRALPYVKSNAPDFLERMKDQQPRGDHTYRFWQRGGGYDRNLMSTDEIWEKIHYLHNNPIKRNLCPTAPDWPWSSAADYAGTRTGPLTLNLASLPKAL